LYKNLTYDRVIAPKQENIMSLITINVTSDDVKIDKLITLTKRLVIQMATTQETVDLLVDQVTKVNTEIVNLKATLEASIAELEAQIAAGGTIDLTALQAAVQSIDDIVPDAVPAFDGTVI